MRMRQRSFIFVAVLVAALLVGAVGAVAYDSSRGDKIAKGVTVSGVDVGGMTEAEARGEVARVLREPLRQPVAAVHGGRRFNLSAEDAGVRADVKGMVDEALDVSREGNIISRVARDLTGGEEDAQVPARIDVLAGGGAPAGQAGGRQRGPARSGRRGGVPVAREGGFQGRVPRWTARRSCSGSSRP